MSYAARLSETAQSSIIDYVTQIEDPVEYQTVVDGIYAEVQRLADNPRLGTVPPGPFGRPIYRFQIRTGGIVRYLQFAFRYSEDEKYIDILQFSPVNF